MKWLGLLLVCVSGALGQAPENWAGAGSAYNQFAQPQVSGWAAFATKLSDKGPIYSFTEYTLTSARTKPFTAQTSTTTGVATPLKVLSPNKNGAWTVTLFGMATGGMATSNSTVGGAFAGGGVLILRLGLSNWTLVGGAQYLTTTQNKQTIYSFGVGRSF
jgi:hypothetical protein